MKATSAASVLHPSSSRRSQPMRQARTNPPRRSTLSTATRNLQRNGVTSSQQQQSGIQRFYPALASFTDSIDALPAEIIRNFTLLREVDAKACHPEEQLRRYIAAVRSLPPPADPNEHDPALEFLRRQDELKRRREEALMAGENPPPETDTDNSAETVEQYPETRRSRLQQIRMVLQDLLPMLDEKIHVITGTAETLNKHNLRVDQAYAYVQSEIPEVYRTGDPEHWGYKQNPPRGATARAAAERAALQALQATNHAVPEERNLEYASTSRAEARREAALSRRQAVHVASHEDEDSLQSTIASTKRPHGNSRVKKDVETTAQRVSEMTIANVSGTTAQSAKRRKPNTIPITDKTALEKASNARGTTSPRAGTPTMGKRTTKGTVATSATTGASGRRRQTAAPPNAQSPSLASSPVQTTFPPNASLKTTGANGKEPNGPVTNSLLIAGAKPSMSTGSGRSGRDKKESQGKEGQGKKDSGGGSGDKDETGEGKPTAASRSGTAKGKNHTGNANEAAVVSKTEVDGDSHDAGIGSRGIASDEGASDVGHEGGPFRNIPALHSERRGSASRGDSKHTLPSSPVKETHPGSPMEGVEPTLSASTSRKSAVADVPIADDAPLPPPKKPSQNAQTPSTPAPSTLSKRKRDSVDHRDDDPHGPTSSSRGYHPSSASGRSHVKQPQHTPKREPPASASTSSSHHHSSHRRTSSTATAAAAAAAASATPSVAPSIHTTSSRPEPPPLPAAPQSTQSKPAANSPDDDEDEEELDPNEPRYCFCNQVSYGEMVACDDEKCEREWFHLDCVGLTQPPKGKAKWYCDDCLTKRKHKGRT
ncbi:hypothetical protein BDZ91DRAFT_722774 [Kalaharituber pfeilii]|nr:hypothetical protein BDZ91DRAFT_722774 [Kalaharituber pfeilii]